MPFQDVEGANACLYVFQQPYLLLKVANVMGTMRVENAAQALPILDQPVRNMLQHRVKIDLFRHDLPRAAKDDRNLGNHSEATRRATDGRTAFRTPV